MEDEPDVEEDRVVREGTDQEERDRDKGKKAEEQKMEDRKGDRGVEKPDTEVREEGRRSGDREEEGQDDEREEAGEEEGQDDEREEDGPKVEFREAESPKTETPEEEGTPDPGVVSEEKLAAIIREIIDKHRRVESLRRLTEMVNGELEERGYQRHTTAARIRRSIIRKDLASVEVKVRRGEGFGLVRECPICGHDMKNERNVTVYGWKITIKKICPKCGYWSDREKTSVARYIFRSDTDKKEERKREIGFNNRRE